MQTKPNKIKRYLNIFGIILGSIFVLCVISIIFVIAGGYNTFKFAGKSMEPTLADGATVITRSQTPTNGDIVVYKANNGVFIHRVIAVPGDQVEFIDSKIIVNGSMEELDYGDTTLPSDSIIGTKFTLPAGKYLILGDNRANAYDSRYSGLVDQEDIIKVVIFYF